jgi:hypothetical protein
MREWSGHSHFRAFYELLPDPPQYIMDFSIHIGDDLGATVQKDIYMGSDYYYLCVFNETTGYYYASDFEYSPGLAANWICETVLGCKIGSWSGGSYGSKQYFWSAYWWNADNPYTTFGIMSGSTSYHIHEVTASPYYEYMTAYYQDANDFYCMKTSS